MPRRPHPTWLALALSAAPALACGAGSSAEEATSGTVANVGELPEPFLLPGETLAPEAPADTTEPPATTAETEETEAAEPDDTTASDDTNDSEDPDDGPSAAGPGSSVGAAGRFGRAAGGNRILVVGDSITAAIGPEFGGQLCEDLTRRGWTIGIDAQQNRDVTQGSAALDDQLAAGEWDAAIVNLGSNYRDDAVAYAAELRRILDRLRPRPVILVTVTEFEERIAEVNYVIRDTARDRDDVWVVEWSERTRADEALTGDDGLHLSEDGREVLSAVLSMTAGAAPDTGFAETPDCVDLNEDAAGSTAAEDDDVAPGGTGDTDAGDSTTDGTGESVTTGTGD